MPLNIYALILGTVESPTRLDIPRLNLGLIAFLAGFLSLAIEVLGLQVTFLFYPRSSEATALGLSAFLTGLGLASWLVQRHNKYLLHHAQKTFAWCLLGVALLSGPVLGQFAVLSRMFIDHSLLPPAAAFAAFCFLYLLIPALLLGFLFPLANDRALRSDTSHKLSTGLINFIDLTGAVSGALLAGFVLLPRLGLVASLWLITAICLALSFLACLKMGGLYRACVLLATILGSAWWFIPGQSSELPLKGTVLFQEQSSFGIVSVTNEPDSDPPTKRLLINRRNMCSIGNRHSQVPIGAWVFLKKEKPLLKVLNIGLGCGFTAQAVVENLRFLQVAVDPWPTELDIVEINPVVAAASKLHFRQETNAVLEDPRVRLHVEDGFQFLLRSESTYDRIVIDIEEPTIMHSTAFYTVDGFKRVKSRLTKNGIFALWSFNQPESAKIILNSLRTVFRYVKVVPGEDLSFFASDDPLPDFPPYDREREQLIEKIPLSTIATIEKNPYPRYYDLRKVFAIPDLEDPYEFR